MASERLHRRLETLLDEAEEGITQLNWVIVQARAQAVLAIDPGNSDGLAFLDTAERALAGSLEQPREQPRTDPDQTPPNIAPASKNQPTSFASGRYEVKRFLGEGGKKKVYLANDTLLDRDVAFALIKTEGLDDVSRTRITREAQAMGRLGSHPHIVTVFDLGEEQGQPFMVTELMGGGDVEGVIEDASDHKLSLEQAINVSRETCRGLEFAHSRGIVHRDLKPGNVWLTSDGVAKIGDFGLAVAIDRSRLTTEGMMVGTVSYMPPEQAMGGAVTPKSDLYSLGAMLYEMVTGRPPFLGDDSVAIIGQHINTPPVAPSWHNPACPRALEALILRLLAKDPQERPESANDVLAGRSYLEYEVGEFHQGAVYLERVIETLSRTSSGFNSPGEDAITVTTDIPLVARITGMTDRLELGEAVAKAVLSSPLVIPSNVTLARAGLALKSVQDGDSAAAGENYPALEPQRGTMLQHSHLVVDRLLGLLSQTMGNLDQAGTHFEDSLAFCRQAGYHPELAWTCCDYADTLQQRAAPGDQEKATSLLDESLAISSELGMKPLMERVLSRRDILKA